MNLSVIIPSRNSDNITACIEAVRKHEPDRPGSFRSEERYHPTGCYCGNCGGGKSPVVVGYHNLGKTTDILIVWDASDGHSVFHNTKVLHVRDPFIFSRNVNIGIREVMKQPFINGVVLLNDDALLESPGGFSLLARAAQEHPEYGIIGATTNVTGQPLQYRQNIGLREVPHIAFVCVYIPRETLERVGLLDERYCIDYGVDDRDYCEAVRRAGLKVGVHDGCYVDHGSLKSSFRGDPKTPKSFAKNYALFRAKCEYCDRTGEPFRAGVGMEVVA